MFNLGQGIDDSPYDVRFPLGGIPVRITPWFWAMTVLMSGNSLQLGVDYVLAWVLVVLVSILVHELGHALAALAFGYRPEITLYQFGGLASFRPDHRLTRVKSIIVSLAGPAAGLLLYGVTKLIAPRVLPSLAQSAIYPLAIFVYGQMIHVNLWWTLMNLLPVLPLDGGRVSEQLFLAASPFRGRTQACWLGVIVGAAVAAYGFTQREMYIAILFGLLAVENYQATQMTRRY